MKIIQHLQFQFHEGPIKTTEKREKALAKMGFNSMKVRLKPDNCHLVVFRAFEFQFHEGPIKTQ